MNKSKRNHNLQHLTSLGLACLLMGSVAGAQANGLGPLGNQPFVKRVAGIEGYELTPSFTGSYKDASFITNRWGMRDKDYSLLPGPKTYRIALLGSSFTMGAGVPEEKTHEALLEERLNKTAANSVHRRFEVLNMAVGGYGILQNVVVADKKVFKFHPNAVFLVIHSIETRRAMTSVILLLKSGTPIEYPELRAKVERTGIRADMEEPELRRRLAPIGPDLVKWGLQRIAALCRERGVPLVGILFAEPRENTTDMKAIGTLASEAGIPLLDLDGAYTGHPFESVQLASGDFHLNELGHKLIADKLYQVLKDADGKTAKLGIWPKR